MEERLLRRHRRQKENSNQDKPGSYYFLRVIKNIKQRKSAQCIFKFLFRSVNNSMVKFQVFFPVHKLQAQVFRVCFQHKFHKELTNSITKVKNTAFNVEGFQFKCPWRSIIKQNVSKNSHRGPVFLLWGPFGYRSTFTLPAHLTFTRNVLLFSVFNCIRSRTPQVGAPIKIDTPHCNN